MRAFMRPFLPASGLLPVATSACAESEWVLWLYSGRQQRGEYSLQGRYPTYGLCGDPRRTT